MSQVLYNGHAHMQAEDREAFVLHWAEIISKLPYGGKDNYDKRIVELLHAETFDLKGKRETIKDVYACARFLRKKDIDFLERDGFRK